jgi:hypothetical protein
LLVSEAGWRVLEPVGAMNGGSRRYPFLKRAEYVDPVAVWVHTVPSVSTGC